MAALSPALKFLQVSNLVAHVAVPTFPEKFGWLALVALGILLIAAVIDWRTGRIPDLLILPASLCLVLFQGLFVSWDFATERGVLGLLAVLIIWSLNMIWRLARRHDALGMGDAKWSAFAVIGFGLTPVAIAWGVGAWGAILYIGAMRTAKREARHVHFAPFLWLGLVCGLWWVRYR